MRIENGKVKSRIKMDKTGEYFDVERR